MGFRRLPQGKAASLLQSIVETRSTQTLQSRFHRNSYGARWDDVSRVFEGFFEVVKPESGDAEATIIKKFPETFKDEAILKSVPKFAFPCDFDCSLVQHYTFVMTRQNAKRTFGFCRHDPNSSTTLVILSGLPWHDVFYKLLNTLSYLAHSKARTDHLSLFLTEVYFSEIPDFGSELEVPTGLTTDDKFIFRAPKPFELRNIPQNRNLAEFYNALGCDSMLIIFASLLFERRIIFKSKKVQRISACVQAANALIYPMNWQHIFIPVLPMHLVDYLLAPMPYLIGIPYASLDKVRRDDMGEVVIVDCDINYVESPFDDLLSLPKSVVRRLRIRLTDPKAVAGDGLSRSFLLALVTLMGGYSDALMVYHKGEIIFNSEAFIATRPTNMRPFLRQMLQLQIFQQFITERIAELKSGRRFFNEFEQESWFYEMSRHKLQAQCEQLTFVVKEKTATFFNRISKVNRAIKSAVHTVQGDEEEDVGEGELSDGFEVTDM